MTFHCLLVVIIPVQKSIINLIITPLKIKYALILKSFFFLLFALNQFDFVTEFMCYILSA